MPLLDEAAELLGEDEAEAAALAERLRREQIAYAEGVLDITAGSGSTDFEVEERVRDAHRRSTSSTPSELAERQRRASC